MNNAGPMPRHMLDVRELTGFLAAYPQMISNMS